MASGQRPAASGHNCARRSRLGSPLPSDTRPGRRLARLSCLLPALALLFGALGLLGAAPVEAQTVVWSATLTVDEDSTYFGCDDGTASHDNCSDALTDNDFTYSGATYKVRSLYWSSGNNQLNIDFAKNGTDLGAVDIANDLGLLTLNVGGTALAVSDATQAQIVVYWTYDPATDWTDGQSLSVSLTASISAPTNLTVTPGDQKLDLSWTAPSETITGYDVHYTSASTATVDDDAEASRYRHPSGAWVDTGHTGTTASSAITGLAGETSYRVRVRAVNKSSNGPWEFGTGTTPPIPASAIPSEITVTTDGPLREGGPPVTVRFTLNRPALGGGGGTLGTSRDNPATILSYPRFERGQTVATMTLSVPEDNIDNDCRTVTYDVDFPLEIIGRAPTVTYTATEIRHTSSHQNLSTNFALTVIDNDGAADTCDGLSVPHPSSLTLEQVAVSGDPDGRISVVLRPRLNRPSPFRDTVRIDTGAGTTALRRRTDPTDTSAGYFYVSGTRLPIVPGDDRPTYTGNSGKQEWHTTLLIYSNSRAAAALRRKDAHNIVLTATSDRFGLSAAPLTLNVGKLRQHLVDGGRGTPCHACASGGDAVAQGITEEAQPPGVVEEVETSPATGADTTAVGPYAALIAQMRGWRNDPKWVSHKSHTDRWDRALKAFGETVADGSLTAMTAAEAQAFADSGMTRWVEVAKALREIESAVAVSLSAAPNPVAEGSTVTVTATLASALSRDVTIPLTLTRDTSEAGDHGTLAGITIPAGSSSVSGTIATARDDDTDDETFTVALGALPTSVKAGGASSVQVTIDDDDTPRPPVAGSSGGPYAALIAQMRGWRNDPKWASYKSHTDRWDRALKAFGETVPDGSLKAMTAAEAQAFADSGMTRWVEVAKALREIESAGAQPPARTPDNDAAVAQPAIETKRGIAREGSGGAVVFRVRLSRAASKTVTVDYATADGAGQWARTAPARAGADYTATSGTLTFASGQTVQTVSVPILDDAIDEGTEYFLLRFSNPQGATLAAGDRETQGLIRNSDPLQAMWLARFGRMVASDAVAALTARLETPRAAGSHLTVLGQRVNLSQDGSGDGAGAQALTDVLTGFAQAFGAPTAPAADPQSSRDDPFARHGLSNAWNDDGATVAGARRVTKRELLMGTSFRAVIPSGAGSQFTGWGQGASVSRFSAAVPGLGLSGEAATGSMGFDYERGRLLTGFAMTHSVGDGTAQDAGWRYRLGSTATTVLPYARLALTDRVSAWAMAGTGTGQLTLDLDGPVSQRYRTDLAMTLAAAGVRGELLSPAEPGGFALALKADAFWVRTEADRVASSEFGSLMGARGESSRVRAVLDGSRSFALAGGATLTPSVELGVRQDGGDAETGTGMEFGAGVGYADPLRGLDMTLRVHGLAMHAEQGYEEWGVSGHLRLVPGGAGRGLSASLTPSYGVDPGGSQRLWALPDASRLTSNGEADPSSRLDAEMGYGMALFGDRFTGTPNVGLGLSDTARDLRMGWRLTSNVRGDPGFEVNLDATRREAVGGEEAPEHGVMLRSLIRW